MPRTEAEIIAEYAAAFREPGRFLEIGAFDGATDSLTLPLVEAGWSGVLVEPEPKAFEALVLRHGGNPRLELVNAAVGDGGLRRFWARRELGQVSTLKEGFPRYWEERGQAYHRPYWVNTIAVPDLLAPFGGQEHWDFLLIDAEGTNNEILRQFTLSTMPATRLVCVESDGKTPHIVEKRLHPWYRTEFIRETNVLGWRK